MNRGDDSANEITADDLIRLVDTAPVGHLIEGLPAPIRWINATLLHWLGYPADEIVNRRCFQDLLAPGDRIYYETHVRPLLGMQGSVTEIAVELVRRDGSRLPVLFNGAVRKDHDAGEDLLEIIVLDATARRSYERELLRERTLAEQSESRLQVMYDVVSGLATATTVDDVIGVLTEYRDRSFNRASFNLWLITPDHRTAVRVGTVAGPDREAGFELTLPAGGPALDQLSGGGLVVISDRDTATGSYPLICEWLALLNRHSAVIAPLRIDGELHGVISYGFQEPHEFDAAEQRAVAAVAVETSLALHRTRLLEAERRSRSRLERLFQFTTQLSGAVSLDDVIDIIVREGASFVSAVGVRVALLDETGTTVTFTRGRGLGGRLGAVVPVAAASIGCSAIRSGRLIVTQTRAELVQRFPASPILAEPSFGRVIAVPLRRGSEVVGAWVLAFADDGPPEEDDLKVIRLFADQAGQAARRAALHEAEAAARALADRRRLVSEALNRASTTDEVGEAVTAQGREVFGADGLALLAIDPDDASTLVLAAHDGLGGDHSNWNRISVDAPRLAQAFERGAPSFVTGASEVAQRFDGTGIVPSWAAMAVLPLTLAGQKLGLLVVGFEQVDRFPATVRVALSGLAAEVGAALARSRRYDIEHSAAITLQRSLLPLTLPTADDWVISSWYAPGSEHLVVGGDLFDVTAVDDGRIFAAVGDIVGHGLGAAASMGQLRSAAKALALDDPNPGRVIGGLQAFARLTPGAMGATICCVLLEPDGSGRYASAGHPFPIVRRADGRTEVLALGRSPLLGFSDFQPGEARFGMEPGDTLVLYTDGLIERRGEVLDLGLERLRRDLGHRFGAAPIDARAIVAAQAEDRPLRDDVVVLCITRARRARLAG